MELPRALWPWRQSLSMFPKNLAVALGGIIDKLSLLVGPLISPDTAGRNEPDGFEGIGRRGSLERLLVSEWALADEAPLEFLRRVSTGELSFLEIAHQKPTVARKCVALFDLGPDQRGGPRIVQLALLILLAQRAYEGGAEFSWGLLQDPAHALFSDVNEESVRQLLTPTGYRRPVLGEVIRFYQSFQDDQAEVWFVGGSGLSNLIADLGACRIQIEDSFDPDAPFDLHVTVTEARGKPRASKLEMPQGNVAVRLLRDPFRVAQAPPQKARVRIAPDTNIVFTRDYRKLFLRGADGELVTIPIPNSPSYSTRPAPRIFRPPPGETIVAVGRLAHTRTIAVATLKADTLLVHELSPRVAVSVRHQSYTWDATSDFIVASCGPPWGRNSNQPQRLGTLLHLGTTDPFYLHDGGNVLFHFGDTQYVGWRSGITHLVHQGGILSWMSGGSEAKWVHHHQEPTNALTLPAGTTEVRFAMGGFLAARTSPTNWVIVDTKGNILQSYEFSPLYEVLGVAFMKEFLFYLMDRERKRILCLTPPNTEPEVLYTSPSPMRSICTTLGCWYIAFLTDDDELCVYARDFKTFVLRMRLGEP